MRDSTVVFARDARDDFYQFFCLEPKGARFPKRAPGDVANAGSLCGQVRRMLLALALERAPPATARQDAFPFEIRIGAIDGMRVDFQVHGDFTHGRQLISRLALSARVR